MHEAKPTRGGADHRYRQADGGWAAGAGCPRELGVTDQTLHNWRSRYCAMEASEARRLRALEEENRRLMTLVAELSQDKEALKAVIRNE